MAAATCISGSRCVTRLIKIPRDLLHRANGRQGGNGRKENEGERESGERGDGVRGRGASVEEKSARATHSAAALSSAHVVSTQFAMKYRGDHRPCADDHNGLPAHLTGCRTQLPLSRSSTSRHSSLPLRPPPLYPRHSYFLENRPVKRGKKARCQTRRNL